MSLINDALKQARQAPPRNPPNSLPPLRPVVEESNSVVAWLLPVLVILLIIGGIFYLGWTMAHRTVSNIVAAPDGNAATQAVAELALPVVKPATPAPPPPLNPPEAPVLQGIFYSPTAPTAIVDGKTIRPGDHFNQYRVKAISKFTVTLIGPDNKEIQIGMGR